MLPPADVSSSDLGAEATDCSFRTLDESGAAAILDSIAEPRRATSTIPPALSSDDDEVATQRRERIAPSDDVFQKIR
jgi:hypothetical protein